MRGHHRRALDAAVLDEACATHDAVIQLMSALRPVRGWLSGSGQGHWRRTQDKGCRRAGVHLGRPPGP